MIADVNEHLIWTNPLALPWRIGLLCVVALVAVGVVAGMATGGVYTWIGILLLLVIAAATTVVHRIGTFVMVSGDTLRFGRYPHPQHEVPLSHVASVRVEELPEHHRTSRPFGALTDAADPTTSVIDVNGSAHVVTLSLTNGRTVKIGTGSHRAAAEEFVAELRKKHRVIRG